MFEHWMRFAPSLSNMLGLDPRQIIQAHDVVCSMMGQEWIDRHDRPRGKSLRAFPDTHPLSVALKGRTQECVLEVLHLAAYFQAFRDTPGLGKAITSMKDGPTYHPTVVELDLAWKFRNSGATVRLFPVTSSGIADFGAAIGAKEHIVEASCFVSDPLRDQTSAFLNAVVTTFRASVQKAKLSFPLSLEVDVSGVEGATRHAAFRAVKSLVQAYKKTDTMARMDYTYEFGTLTIRPTALAKGIPNKRWTCAMRIGCAPLAASKLFGETEYAIEGPGSIVLLHDRSKTQDPFVQLSSKLKDEAKQVSGCEDAILIIDVEAIWDAVLNDRQRLGSVINDFARQHRSTTGVAIIVRSVREDGRQRALGGHYFPLSRSAMPVEFWNRMVKVDKSKNLLDELRALP